ncbi:MAG: hypothetical protein ACO3CC_20070 [Alphaproteobacteria bacterium]
MRSRSPLSHTARLLAAERAAKSGLGRAGTLAAQRALYAIAGAQAARGGLSAWT